MAPELFIEPVLLNDPDKSSKPDRVGMWVMFF